MLFRGRIDALGIFRIPFLGHCRRSDCIRVVASSPVVILERTSLFGGELALSYFPDLARESLVAAGDHVRAVGWLEPDYPYTKGEVPAEFLARLRQFVAQSGYSSNALYFGAYGGYYTCEFCNRAHGVSNFGVPSGDLLYVAPEMIVHSIEVHGYSPPAEFITAVMRCPLPETEEYQIITEPFCTNIAK